MSKQKKYYAGHKVHGVHIPPRKRELTKQKNVTLEFVLTGTVPSKKNMQQPTFNHSHVNKQLNDYFFALAPSASREDTLKFVRSLINNIRCYIRNSDVYNRWLAKQREVVISQAQELQKRYSKHGLQYPISKCSISIMFYWADDRTRDNSNKAETIHDMLVSTGIILDDNYTCLYKQSTEAENHKGEINNHIAQIFITAYDW